MIPGFSAEIELIKKIWEQRIYLHKPHIVFLIFFYNYLIHMNYV
jgi:hypothetical protein